MKPHNHAEMSPERQLSYEVFSAFHRAMHAHRQLMARRMSAFGSHPGQAVMVREIAHNEGITQRDLAEKLQVARPSVTTMLQRLEKAGLVERRPDERDQRYTRIYLSEQGRALHDEAHRNIDRIVDETVGRMPADDQRNLALLLTVFADYLSETNPDTPQEEAE